MIVGNQEQITTNNKPVMTKDTTHIGRKIARIRELRGMKQEALALELGISQQAISKIEQSETVEEETLERVAKALGVNSDAIKAFNDEAIINIIANTFNNDAAAYAHNYKCSFNPIDKIVELYEEKQALMERLLESEREKVEILKGKLDK